MRVDYTLANVPTAVNILSMSAFLDTSFRITSPTEPSKILTETILRTPLFQADGDNSVDDQTVILVTDGNGNPIPADVLPNSLGDSGRSPTPTESRQKEKPFQAMQAGGSIYVRFS